MLQVKNLTITHKKDLRTIMKDVSFTLNKGDKMAMIGEEGNGKSTLLKLIQDESLVDGYVEYSGEIIKNSLRTGYLSQELTECDQQKNVYEYCCERDLLFERTPGELAEIARQLGVPFEFFYSEQEVRSLSGGERVKLQLARLLMDQPEVLLLDEPSNDIDMDTLGWLEQFIKESQVPVLYISHDEMLLENTANRILHIEQIRRKTVSRVTVSKMGYREYVETREKNLAHQKQIAQMERSEYAKQQEKFRRIQQKVEHQQEKITRQDPQGARLLKKKMHAVKSQERRFEKQKENFSEFPDTEDAVFMKFRESRKIPNGKHVLEFEADSLEAGGKVLAKGIHLSIVGPERVCIIGKNGAGKSTLLKKILKQLSGREDIRFFYMPQNYEELLEEELSPVEYLTVTGDREENIRICTWLGSMKFTADEMHHRIAELSGGQKAKILFLKMTMNPCDFLLLDEPTRNFSPLSGPVIRELLKGFPGAVLGISHDRKFISEVCTKVYELTPDGLDCVSLTEGENQTLQFREKRLE